MVPEEFETIKSLGPGYAARRAANLSWRLCVRGMVMNTRNPGMVIALTCSKSGGKNERSGSNVFLNNHAKASSVQNTRMIADDMRNMALTL